MATTIGIAGITGRLARSIAAALLRRQPAHPSGLHIRGFTRDASHVPAALLDSPHVSIVTGASASDAAALRAFVRGCDVVICCYSVTEAALVEEVMVRGQLLLADLCAEEGVRRFLPSDFAYDYTRLEYGELLVKESSKRVKEYVDAKEGVQGVHVMLGCFMELLLYGIGVWRPAQRKLVCWGSGEERWDLTTYADGGEYTAAVALDQAATGVFRFRGDRKSTHEIAEAFKDVCGFKPEIERLCGLEELRENMGQGVQQNPVLAAVYYILSGKTTFGDDYDNSRYPEIKPANFSDFLKTHQLLENSAKKKKGSG
ncbi:hypothetical protein B0J12DRAFT_787435 [Macrophomina phaseolina]|uniref:NmrA-like domain-containing protein n=1 Tax=Macrophomina phaseolina TaxID=35725 RepID=A0ABQ8G4V0_9PEZI|nr:hypothetical protein B0J12DRAFT_787435 [Macrophomina phaseolina]